MVNIETVAITTGAFILFLTFLGWLLNRGNGGTNNPNPSPGSGPQINHTVQRRGGGSPSDGDNHNDVYIQARIQDTSGNGLDQMEVTFEGTSTGSINLADQDSETRQIYLDQITGGGTLTTGNTYNYQIEVQDNNGGDTTEAGSFSIGPSTSPAPQLNVHVVGTPQVGKDRSDIQLNIQSQAQAGKNLDEIKVGLTDSNGNNWTHGPVTIGSPNFTDTIDLATICGADQTINNPKAFNYDVRVTDSGSEMQDAHGTININDNNGPGPDPDNDVNVQQILQALLGGNVVPGPNGNLIINNQQQQQQMMGPGGTGGAYGGISPHLYTMMMQQMQQMQMSQQQMMQQMMQFMQQNSYNQINNQVIVQFMQQVLDIDIDMDDLDSDGSGGDTNVNVEIKKVVNNLNVQRIENNLLNVVKNVDVSINQRLELEIERIFTGIIQIINNNQYEIQGDVIILNTSEGDEKVKIQTLTQFLNILSVIKKWEMNALIMAIANQEIDINASLEVKLEELIVIYQEAEKNQKKNTNIVIEDLELKPRPKPGMSSSDITFYTRCGSNTKLQEIMLNFDGNQKVIGVSSPSKEVNVSLSSIIGSHQFQAGETHNYSTKVIDQTGNSRNRTKQVSLGGSANENKIDLTTDGLIEEIRKAIKELKKSEDLELQILKERKAAMKKLKEALDLLLDDGDILDACLYFRKVDFSKPHAEVYEQVQKIINKLGAAKNADDLEKTYNTTIEPALEDINDAMEILQDIMSKEKDLLDDIEEVEMELDQIINVVEEVQLGGENWEKVIEQDYHQPANN